MRTAKLIYRSGTMAKRLGHSIDIRDVHKVARRYNEVWRQYVKFPTTDSEWEGEPRLGDHDLWDQGLPALQTGGTVGDGFGELVFTFQNSTEQEADSWVRGFLQDNKLPFTFYKVKPSRNLKGLINYAPGETVPTYIRVIVRFEVDEVFNKRTRQLREARYHDPLSVANVTKMYERKLAPYVSSELHRQNDEPSTKLELGGHPVRLANVQKSLPDELESESALEYCLASFLFYSNTVELSEAQELVKEFMKSLKLPMTYTTWEHEAMRYDEDRIKIYEPIRVFAIYNPRARA